MKRLNKKKRGTEQETIRRHTSRSKSYRPCKPEPRASPHVPSSSRCLPRVAVSFPVRLRHRLSDCRLDYYYCYCYSVDCRCCYCCYCCCCFLPWHCHWCCFASIE